jgi:tight adherence protein B
VIGLLVAGMAACGTYLVYTAFAFGWRGFGAGRADGVRAGRGAGDAPVSRGGVSSLLARLRDWLAHAGLADVPLREIVMAVAAAGLAAGFVGLVIFGAPGPAAALALGGAVWPVATWRSRRRAHRAAAQEAWPHLIEEIRLLTGAVGRSVPQALFEAGRRAPEPLKPAFDAAHREWVLSTDFERTIAVLKARLADPTADAACETLLIAYDVGGGDLDGRLEALVRDRVIDVQGRKDAVAKQAGVRFARRFVLLVPFGMALAGMSIGTGRDAYRTSLGQALVVVGIAVVGLCWLWAGALLRLPDEERVFQ